MGYETVAGRRSGVAPELIGAALLIALAVLIPLYLLVRASITASERCVVTERSVSLSGQLVGLEPGDTYRPDSGCAPGDTTQRRELRFGVVPVWVAQGADSAD